MLYKVSSINLFISCRFHCTLVTLLFCVISLKYYKFYSVLQYYIQTEIYYLYPYRPHLQEVLCYKSKGPFIWKLVSESDTHSQGRSVDYSKLQLWWPGLGWTSVVCGVPVSQARRGEERVIWFSVERPVCSAQSVQRRTGLVLYPVCSL